MDGCHLFRVRFKEYLATLALACVESDHSDDVSCNLDAEVECYDRSRVAQNPIWRG